MIDPTTKMITKDDFIWRLYLSYHPLKVSHRVLNFPFPVALIVYRMLMTLVILFTLSRYTLALSTIKFTWERAIKKN